MDLVDLGNKVEEKVKVKHPVSSLGDGKQGD